ncbi:MAG: DNA adenine methylase [Desulfuromonadales bacterium]|nr:DNA adenine methylase [Desulfuromonadales bacterium]
MIMQISYMGTKRQIAPLVSDAISTCQDGPLLDLFSGMCAVGSEVGTCRQVWSNDAQLFAANVARAFFTSLDLPLGAEALCDQLRQYFLENQSTLTAAYHSLLTEEKEAISAESLESLLAVTEKLLAHKAFSGKSDSATSFPYCLFSEIYAGGYFSLEQTIEIDSIRYAADQARERGGISSEQHRWILLGLAQTLSKVSNTTGHFAQYLKLKKQNLKRCLKQKSRGVWGEWLGNCDFMTPVGGNAWRKGNKAFNGCSLNLLDQLQGDRNVPAIIYADPPYTADQYSRYYHIYETLFLYDYPEVTGIGQYRPGRFTSSFSLKTEVIQSMSQLIAGCSNLKADLVLSYPGNGLLPNAREQLPKMLKEHYSSVEIAYDISHKHSSMGGSKGQQKHDVQELIFVARKRCSHAS